MSECSCSQCDYARKHPQLGPAPHGNAARPVATMEHERFLRVVSMNAESAKAFAMPDAVKVVCVGQADATRYKFGSRNYLLFATWDDYQAWRREGGAA